MVSGTRSGLCINAGPYSHIRPAADDGELFKSKEVGAFCDSRQKLASNVTVQLAAALASLSLRERLRDQSLQDPLTDRFHRRAMQDALARAFHRARRRNHELSLLLIDLNHFKSFNDTYGHEAGDLMLKTTAKLCMSQFRAEDLVGRFGGEQFAILLPEASLGDAAKRATQLCCRNSEDSDLQQRPGS